MSVISKKDGDLLSQFDNINENDIKALERLADLPPQNKSTPHQKMLINNHTDANKVKTKGYLYLEDIFGLCKSSKKVTENLGFHLMLKTANLQNFVYTSKTDDINVTIKNLYLFIPNLIPSVETQLLFNEATQRKYKISYDEYYTERRVITDLLVQHAIGSAQQVNSPDYLIRAHQTKDRFDSPNKNQNIAIFYNLDLRKFYVEKDGQRYPRDGVSTNFTEKDYLDQYREFKTILSRMYRRTDIKSSYIISGHENKYPIGIMDLRHQLDYKTPKKIQLFQDYGTDPDNARLFQILI